MTIHKLGWVVAAGLVGSMVGMGFHAPGEKTGNVDVAKVFAECTLVKKQSDNLKNQYQARQAVIDFLKTNPYITVDKATKFRDLSLKTVALTAADKASLEALKTESLEASTKMRTLIGKEKPAAADLTQIEDFNKKKDTLMETLQRWVQEFGEEMNQKQSSSRQDLYTKIQEAASKVAKEQGYSIVFTKETAIYSANDITAETTKAVDKMSL